MWNVESHRAQTGRTCGMSRAMRCFFTDYTSWIIQMASVDLCQGISSLLYNNWNHHICLEVFQKVIACVSMFHKEHRNISWVIDQILQCIKENIKWSPVWNCPKYYWALSWPIANDIPSASHALCVYWILCCCWNLFFASQLFIIPHFVYVRYECL